MWSFFYSPVLRSLPWYLWLVNVVLYMFCLSNEETLSTSTHNKIVLLHNISFEMLPCWTVDFVFRIPEAL